jgi:hypothetical protein
MATNSLRQNLWVIAYQLLYFVSSTILEILHYLTPRKESRAKPEFRDSPNWRNIFLWVPTSELPKTFPKHAYWYKNEPILSILYQNLSAQHEILMNTGIFRICVTLVFYILLIWNISDTVVSKNRDMQRSENNPYLPP